MHGKFSVCNKWEFLSPFQECFNGNHYTNKYNKLSQHELIFLFTLKEDAKTDIRENTQSSHMSF